MPTWIILALSVTVPEPKELPLYEMPQIVCPISIEEYLTWYKPWARNKIKLNQGGLK